MTDASLTVEFQTPETVTRIDARGKDQPIAETHVIDERLSVR